MPQIITYWLCPTGTTRGTLSAIIKGLAARFDAPVFEPHVTVFAAAASNKDPAEVLEEIQLTGPLQLAVGSLESSDEFTKTLFIQLEPNAALSRVSEDLRRASVTKSEYQLNPHLSLIYKNMSPHEKQELAAQIYLPFSEIAFDSIKAVLIPAEIKTREDVETWRTIAERNLTG